MAPTRSSPPRPLVPDIMNGEFVQRFLRQVGVVRKEVEVLVNYINQVPRQLVGGTQQARYQLKFQNKLRQPLHASVRIKGEDGFAVKIALIDITNNEIVRSGPFSSIKIKIVLLHGDFNKDGHDNWSEEEFDNQIVRERGNVPALKGVLDINLNNGVASLADVKIMINSKQFRLGAKLSLSEQNVERVQEGISEPFRVMCRRSKSQKHRTPSLDDDVWCLERIAKEGKFRERLQNHGINTVEDFLKSYFMDKAKLRQILGKGMYDEFWNVVIKNARACQPGNKLYSYCIREHNVVLFFYSHYELVGVKFGDCYTTLDKLDASKQVEKTLLERKDLVESWKKLAYKNMNGKQFTHEMIDNHPTALLDATSIPESSSMQAKFSNFHMSSPDQVAASFGLCQETSIASEIPHAVLMEGTSNGLYVHQMEQPATFGEACGDVSFERDNSLAFIPPTQIASTDHTVSSQSSEFQPANYDEQTTQLDFQYPAESPQFMEPLRVQSSFSSMSSFDMSSFNGLSWDMPETSMNNLPDSSGGETSRSMASLSSPARWVKLLAPIKWVHFAKKRRARILIHQTLVATV